MAVMQGLNKGRVFFGPKLGGDMNAFILLSGRPLLARAFLTAEIREP